MDAFLIVAGIGILSGLVSIAGSLILIASAVKSLAASAKSIARSLEIEFPKPEEETQKADEVGSEEAPF